MTTSIYNVVTMSEDRRIGIRELKRSASRVVSEVRERGGEYVVTRRGKPVAVLRAWNEGDAASERQEAVATVLAHLEGVAGAVEAAAGRRSAEKAVDQQRR